MWGSFDSLIQQKFGKPFAEPFICGCPICKSWQYKHYFYCHEAWMHQWYGPFYRSTPNHAAKQ